MKRSLGVIILAGVFIFLMHSFLFSQEEEYQWVWGEVVSVDAQNKLINIKYLDYESDTEKEMSFVIDDKTNFEGVNSLSDIKVNDTVSIDYIIKDNKNIARTISVEKPEDVTTEATPNLTPAETSNSTEVTPNP